MGGAGPRLRSIKGVADRTVARLMAEMPEIGTLAHKAISKLASLAPRAEDSRQHRDKRRVRRGRSAVREILFVIAYICGRYEPDFIAFRDRLLAAGKPPKVMRIALVHKLRIRLNAKARDVRLPHEPCQRQTVLCLNHSSHSRRRGSWSWLWEEQQTAQHRFPPFP